VPEKKKLGLDPSQCAYLCRHNLIGIRRARELEAEGWGSLSLSVSLPWRSIHSSSIHSVLKESQSMPGSVGNRKTAEASLQFCRHMYEMHRFEKSKTQSSFKAAFKKSMRQDGTDRKHGWQRPSLV
jgi:hypothetical protein